MVAVYERKWLAVDRLERKFWRFRGIEAPYNRPPLMPSPIHTSVKAVHIPILYHQT